MDKTIVSKAKDQMSCVLGTSCIYVLNSKIDGAIDELGAAAMSLGTMSFRQVSASISSQESPDGH